MPNIKLIDAANRSDNFHIVIMQAMPRIHSQPQPVTQCHAILDARQFRQLRRLIVGIGKCASVNLDNRCPARWEASI